MRRISRFAAMSALVIPYMVSCSSEKTGHEPEEGRDGILKLGFSISAPEVRSPQLDDTGAGVFSPEDVICLSLSAEDGDAYRMHELKAGNAGLKWSDSGLDGTAGEVGISGCYPVLAQEDGMASFDVRDQGEECDLLLSGVQTVRYGFEEEVRMDFTHAMHQLKVIFSSADGTVTDGELKSASTVLEALSSCQVDMKKGEVLSADISSRGKYTALTGKSVSFLAVPQKNENIVLTVSVAGAEKAFPLPSQTVDGKPLPELEGGVCLTMKFDVTRKDDQTSITVTGSQISGWEDGGTIDGSIEL